MDTVIISELSMAHIDAIATYLVGGFDNEKNFTPALPIFRYGLKERLYDTCSMAEAGEYQAIKKVENLIIMLLSDALDMQFDGVHYLFDIRKYEDQAAMDYLVWEVLAQVNEE